MKATVPFVIKVECPGGERGSGYWFSTVLNVNNRGHTWRRDNAIAALLAANAAVKTWPLRNFIS